LILHQDVEREGSLGIPKSRLRFESTDHVFASRVSKEIAYSKSVTKIYPSKGCVRHPHPRLAVSNSSASELLGRLRQAVEFLGRLRQAAEVSNSSAAFAKLQSRRVVAAAAAAPLAAALPSFQALGALARRRRLSQWWPARRRRAAICVQCLT
jgi:hypothetical protein